MKAKKKPFQVIGLDELALSEAEIAPRTERSSLSLPPQRNAGQILQGELKEQAAELVSKLRTEAKVI
ncbi:hypothetical protein D3C77_690820 [compost metagenome]